MAKKSEGEGHNGHRNDRTGAERVRSGFDRRRNWGDSIENVYRRIDHRLSELVQEGAEEGEPLPSENLGWAQRRSTTFMIASFLSGLLFGLWVGRRTND